MADNIPLITAFGKNNAINPAFANPNIICIIPANDTASKKIQSAYQKLVRTN